MKTYIQLAGLVVDATFQHEYLYIQCKDYCVENPSVVDMEVSVSMEDIEQERDRETESRFPDSYLESLAFYRKFAEKAIEYDCILFHGSAVSVDGEGYLFGAPSGTGKSTHASIYRKVFGERVIMINDDKPLIRKINDVFYVYGTPWDGKHRLSNNIAVPLKGLCFLKQGQANEIRQLSSFEALSACLGQTYRPTESAAMTGVLNFVQNLLNKIPAHELQCTISKEAAELSYRTMKGEYSV